MTHWGSALHVARWEFRRFIKVKQQMIGLVITLASMGAVMGIQEIARRGDRDVADVAVIGAEGLTLDAGAEPAIRLLPHPASAADSLRAEVGRRRLKGLLIVRSPDDAELHVSKDPVWRGSLERVLSQARQRQRLAEARLEPTRVAALLAPMRVDVRMHEGERKVRSTRFWGVAAMTFMLLALFTGAANVFVSITGEKQLRVTEQVVSAVRPQAWMDGKILGLTAVALVSALNMSIAVFTFLMWRTRDRGGVDALGASPGMVLVFLTMMGLGCLFWLALFGAVAATIDDPNSSTRSALLFLPMLSAAPAAMIITQPDGVLARVVSLVPLTSPTALPVRMILGTPAWWEIAASIAILAASVWWVRLVAGRIYHFGMLMYGKEASWGEMRRWAGRA